MARGWAGWPLRAIGRGSGRDSSSSSVACGSGLRSAKREGARRSRTSPARCGAAFPTGRICSARPPLQSLGPAVIDQAAQRVGHARLEDVGGMKEEMRDAVMPQGGIEQLPAVFGRADHHQVLRQQVDLQHVQEAAANRPRRPAGSRAASRPAESRSCPSCSARASGRSRCPPLRTSARNRAGLPSACNGSCSR